MIEIFDCQTPSPSWWLTVIEGMRHPKKSYEKIDSSVCDDIEEKDQCQDCIFNQTETDITDCYKSQDSTIVLGKNDLKLMQNLIRLGPSDRKFMRQLPCLIDISAPEYFWRQLDQYKVGTVTNSTSQMHRLAADGISINDFSLTETPVKIYDNEEYDHCEAIKMLREEFGYSDELIEKYDPPLLLSLATIVDIINDLLALYNITHDRKYYLAALQLIPQSFNYRKLWSGTYENLRNIYHQRKKHKLPEWHQFCKWIEDNVPYAKELIVN